jgi:serine incorporator 1/3
MLFVGILWLGSFYIPNGFFVIYSKWAVYLAGIYLLVQIISLIDAFYLWAEFWAKKFDSGNQCYGCLLIFVTIVMYLFTGYILYYSFSHFWAAGCTTNKIMLVLMTLFPIIYTSLLVLKIHPSGSLITSGAISLYGTFLIWTAFISFPNKQAGITCNPVIGNALSMYLQLGTGLLVGLVCTFYWSLSTSASSGYTKAGVQAVVSEPEEILKPEEEPKTYKQERLIDPVQNNIQEDFTAYEDGSYVKFHIFMMLFSFYISPLFTNWGNT